MKQLTLSVKERFNLKRKRQGAFVHKGTRDFINKIKRTRKATRIAKQSRIVNRIKSW